MFSALLLSEVEHSLPLSGFLSSSPGPALLLCPAQTNAERERERRNPGKDKLPQTISVVSCDISANQEETLSWGTLSLGEGAKQICCPLEFADSLDHGNHWTGMTS